MVAETIFAQKSSQGSDAAIGPHEHMNMNAGSRFMQDGVFFAEFNHQGSASRGNEIRAPNWWMGMASRDTSHGQVTFTSMLSLVAN
jgi:hypothetical protein